MAFSIPRLCCKCKAVPSGPVLLTPLHFPVSSGTVALELCSEFFYSVCFSAFVSIYIGKNTPALSQSTCSVLHYFPWYVFVLNWTISGLSRIKRCPLSPPLFFCK